MNKFFLSLYFCCTAVLVSLLIVTSFQEKIQNQRYPLFHNFENFTSAKIKINQNLQIFFKRESTDSPWQLAAFNSVYLSQNKLLKFMDLLPTFSSKFERGVEKKGNKFSETEYPLSVELKTKTEEFVLLKFKLGKEIKVLSLPEARHYRLRANELENWQIQDFFVSEIEPLWSSEKPQNIQLTAQREIKLFKTNHGYTFAKPYEGYFADSATFKNLIHLLQEPLKFENIFYQAPTKKKLVWTNWQFLSKDKKLNLDLAIDEYDRTYLRYAKQPELLVVDEAWKKFVKNSAFDLLDKQIFTVPLKAVREIEFQHNQQYFRARFYWRKKKLLHASFEGLPLSQEQLKQYFYQINELKYEQPLKERFYPAGLPQAALRYRLANGEKHYIAFYRHPSSSYYAVSFDRLRPYFLAPSYQFTRLQATALAMIFRP